MVIPKHVIAATAFLAAALSASALEVQLTIQNLAPQNPLGLYFGPVWLGFHDSGYHEGEPASWELPAGSFGALDADEEIAAVAEQLHRGELHGRVELMQLVR